MVAAIDSAGTSETCTGELIAGATGAPPITTPSALSTPASVAAGIVAELPSARMTGGVPDDPKTRSPLPSPAVKSRSTTAGPLRAQ
jgi:hypothetical protein